MNKNILIIGGSYFCGRALVEALVKSEEITLSVFNRGNIPLGIQGVEHILGDRTDPGSIRQGIGGRDWDTVVDFCGYSPTDIKTLLDNIEGRIGQYIFISTATVYDHSALLPLDEESPTVTGPQPELGDYATYAWDKVRAEGLLKEYCRAGGISWTILRPAIIYGRFNYAPREDYFFERIENRLPIVIPEPDLSMFSFLYVDDLAAVVIQCLGNKKTENKVFNTVAPGVWTYHQYLAVLERIMQIPVEYQKMSSEDILNQNVPLPFPIDHHQIYSGERLIRALDINFTPMHKGLEKTYRFYRFMSEQKKKRAAHKG